MEEVKKPKVVIITGSPESGKDTFFEMCGKFANVRSVSSIEIVKKAARMLGWTNGKRPQDRKFLQELKALSIWYNNQPYEMLSWAYENACKEGELDILFMHVREADEIEKIIDTIPDVTVLLIVREVAELEEYTKIMLLCNHVELVINNADEDTLLARALDFVRRVLSEDGKGRRQIVF